MSEILNRMLSRARAPLSNVEPLYSPRYAESQRGGKASPAERAEIDVISMETNGAKPGADEEATTAHETHRTATKEVESSIGNGKRTLSTIPRVVHEEPPGLFAPRNVRDFDEKKAPEIRRGENAILPSEVRQVLPAKASLTEAKPGTAERRVSPTVVITAITARNPELPRVQTSLHERQKPAFSRGGGGDARNLAAGTADQKPSVTISIGHIEIRAAQTVDRPRKAPFRPKVSLDDFLSRKQGGARE